MSRRYQGGVLGVGFNPLRAPNAPTIGTATAGDTTASVAFTAPACVGGSAITSYAVQSTPGGIGASGASSPITVTGLTNCTAYTFRTTALNSYGPSPASAASNSVTPIVPPVGQQAYTTAGTFSWVAPAGVTSVSVVAIAGGNGGGIGGGAGGGAAYLNNITVIPGNSYAVVVGAGGTGTGGNAIYGNKGGNSSFNGSAVVATSGSNTANGPGTGGSFSGAGVSGYSGGITFNYFGLATRGGNGGANANGEFQANQYSGDTAPGQGSSGGAIGGAGGGGSGTGVDYGVPGGGGGGGSGLGYAGTSSAGQSGGVNGANGGTYGGGGAGANADAAHVGGTGARGAVRIIWPGTTRSFPSTNTGNL